MPNITINGVRRRDSYEDSAFQNLYENLFSQSPDLSDDDIKKLLRWALFFFNADDEGIKRLGYRIIVRYSNLFNDYIPLYDISLNAGFIPVSKYIESHYFNAEATDSSFLNTYLSAFKEIFKDGNKYLSAGQKELIEFSRSINDDALVVAPTSYGKSEMMISKVAENLDKKVCIIVPSKALLAQTKRRLLDDSKIASEAKRIITHPEMYREEDATFVAVLTQERLLRLLQQHPNFDADILMVDEAHNLLDGGERGALLLQVILILRHRRPDIELKFYTPFLASPKSIETPYSDYALEFRHVKEYIKIEKYFIYDANDSKTLKLYDQFLNTYIPIAALDLDGIAFAQKYKASKNIVYLNKPRDVEDVAMRLSNDLPDIDFSEGMEGKFKDAYQAISDFLHPDYKLLKCLKKGVIYHHGRIPEIIRLYIERIFSEHPDFSFIVTSSTLLEGVNIPAEKMFLFDVKKGRQILRRSAFKNLTGRACRFSEIFSAKNDNLRMLEPEIYIVKGDYTSSKFNPETFFKTRAKWQDDSKDQDEIGNVLLKKEYEEDEEEQRAQRALEYIENVEPGTIGESSALLARYVTSDIAKLCFKNNIHEFDIHRYEDTLVNNLAQYKDIDKINNPNTLLDVISHIFIDGIEHVGSDEFVRIQNQAAQNFYSLILSWKMRAASFNEMIRSVLSHWNTRQENARFRDDHLVYVGHSWGDVKRDPEEHVPRYIDLRSKQASQRVNLAIVRIKEEQDFVEYNLMKYIEILNDLEMLDTAFYEQVKYGSSDPKTICLLKNGISMELAKLLLDSRYKEYLDFDLKNDQVKISKDAIKEMEEADENQVLIFELEFHAV